MAKRKAGKKTVRKKVVEKAEKKRRDEKKAAKKGKKRGDPKTAKRKAAKKKAKRKVKKTPGYEKNPGGEILVRKSKDKPKGVVNASKIKAGLQKARSEIEELLDELTGMTDGFDVSEMSLTVSFSADGKFLGIGVGGATSIGIKLTPSVGDSRE